MNVTPQHKLDGIGQKLPKLSNELAKIYDKTLDLEIKASWYYEPDSQWGGPPTPSELRKTSQDLRQIYMNLSLLAGLDPCEQFEETLQKNK